MVLVFGSINIDFVTRVEEFPAPGETVSGTSFAVYPGGKGANQALASARAGAQTRLVGAVGNDTFAATALALVRAAGVDLALVARVAQTTGCATIMVSDSGENAIISVPGANAMADPGTIPDAMLSGNSTVSLQNELPQALNQALIQRARRNGSRVVLNASPWRTPLPDMLRALDCLILNELEAATLAETFAWPRSLADLALATASAFGNLTVVITLGRHGALAASGSKIVRVAAPNVRVIDTTGAGDAFAGTLIAALDENAALSDALRIAVAAGSLACTAAGAQPSFPERSATDAVLRQIVSPTSDGS